MALSAEKALPTVLCSAARLTDAPVDTLETLVREHGRLVYRVAYSALRHHQDAEDVAQETFLRLLRQRAEWPHIRDMRAWLARVAWRAAADRRRQRPASPAAAPGVELDQLLAAQPDAERMAASRQMMDLTARMIQTLPAALRDPLLLSTVQELTSAQAAEALGIPEGMVRRRVQEARELLKQKLAAILEGKHEP